MEEYIALVRAFPLVSIRDEEHLHQALAVLDTLLGQAGRSEAQEAYLGALGDIIEAFEQAHVPIPKASGVQVLVHLMEENDLRQKDMDFAFGNKAVTSAVINGARPIGLKHARRLSERFALPLDVFIAGT
jgi:HTH-type transcriptional regulator/antitoxin HigA